MRTTLRRTKSISIGTTKLIEVDCDELFAPRAFNVSQISRSNIYRVVHAATLRRFECLVNRWRQLLQAFI
ncbi:hypothetical protein HMPREF9696_03973 [Afipia clevelandensis ATCC 49720]|uniref:Uncharacterized protein n=1 Tax=Afipia clevelandensis ATCC 49720 TaxID=883079 RepID=K8NN60_9BRAD|nr:hypothetical protein HMPREF9696_03973 [Afipia clevelandensis ATCC 49720]